MNATDRLTYNHPRHPAWLRVWLYAMDHNGEPLDRCELKDATDLQSRTLYRGIQQARKMGLITAGSHARCLTVQHLPLSRQVSSAS